MQYNVDGHSSVDFYPMVGVSTPCADNIISPLCFYCVDAIVVLFVCSFVFVTIDHLIMQKMYTNTLSIHM